MKKSLVMLKIHFRKNFFSGLLAIVPVFVTIIIIKAVFTFLDSLLIPVLKPFGIWVPGIGILITLSGIYLVGVMITNFIGKKFVQFGEKIVLKIPLAKSIYASIKQIVETFAFKEENSNKKVVMIEFPKENIWTVGLINGEMDHPVTKQKLYKILVLASISPMTGFFIMVPIHKAIQLDITVEEAMKWIVSGGIVTPSSLQIMKKETTP